MTKYEFLETLRKALVSIASPEEVEENCRYYSSYIDNEMAAGKSETEVMETLGDPRLIAKTIKDAKKYGGKEGGSAAYTGGSRVVDEEFPNHEDGRDTRVYRMPGWLVTGIVVLVLVLVVMLVGSLVSALLPVLIPLLLFILVIRLLFGSGRS